MSFITLQGKSFSKSLPGADCVFQPEDIDEYRKDPWDIRISVGDAPLEEAFYYTMQDPETVRLPIGGLLDDHALNPANRDKLDVADYPDLPFIQEELIQYRANAARKLLDVEFYVNNSPTTEPVNLRDSADKHLSVCTYHDGSEDYRVLDLVLVPSIPELRGLEADKMRRSLGRVFVLLLLDYHMARGDAAFADFVHSEPVSEYLSSNSTGTYPNFVAMLRRLDIDQLIDTAGGTSTKERTLLVTDAGLAEIKALKEESANAEQTYDRYDSVAIAPPALGVPGGFDVRVQMMEYDRIDVLRTVMLRVLEDTSDEFFGGDTWGLIFESLSFCNPVRAALAYKTNFSNEVLQSLKEIAGN